MQTLDWGTEWCDGYCAGPCDLLSQHLPRKAPFEVDPCQIWSQRFRNTCSVSEILSIVLRMLPSWLVNRWRCRDISGRCLIWISTEKQFLSRFFITFLSCSRQVDGVYLDYIRTQSFQTFSSSSSYYIGRFVVWLNDIIIRVSPTRPRRVGMPVWNTGGPARSS